MKTSARKVAGISASFLALSAGLLLSGCSNKGEKSLLEANKHFEAADYDKAEIEYKNVLQAKKLDPVAVGRLGIIYAEDGRIRQGIAFLLKARELNPENLEVRRKLASIYVAFGKFKEAREEALFLLSKNPADEIAPVVLIESSLPKADEFRTAKEKLAQLPEPARSGAPALVAAAIGEMKQKNGPAAEALLNRAIAANPKFAPAYSALAGLYRVDKDGAKIDAALKTAADLSPLRSGKKLQLAQYTIAKGDREKGRALLQELTTKAPDYLPAQLVSAELAFTEKKYDECDGFLNKLLSRDPEHPEAMLLSGRLKLAQGLPDKAVATLERVLKVYPNAPHALYLSGLAYAAAGDRQKAIDRLSQSVARSPSVEAVLALANLNFRNGDYAAVITGLKPLVQQRPDNVPARLTLAEAYRAQGNFDDAMALYSIDGKDSASKPQIALLKGRALAEQRKYAEARGAFEAALAAAPGWQAAIEQLIGLDLVEGHADRAAARAAEALAKTPNSAELLVLQAKVMMLAPDFPKAETALKKAIELKPDSPDAYYQLARLYVASNQQAKALENLETVVKSNPKNTNALLLMALLHEQGKSYDKAREAYEKLLTLDPKSIPALNNLGYLYSEHFHEMEKAQEVAQKARDLAPNEPHIADTLGWILSQRGQLARGLALIQECAEKIGNDANVQYHLGVTQYSLGLEQPARISLQKALALSGKEPWAPDAQGRLKILTTPPESSQALEAELATRPGDIVVTTRLAAVYERANEVDKALAAYQRLAKASPSSVTPLVAMAQLYAKKKDSTRALEMARAARKVAPDDTESGKILGGLAYDLGDYGWSATLLEDAARRRPADRELVFLAAKALFAVGKLTEATALAQQTLNLPDSNGEVHFGGAPELTAPAQDGEPATVGPFVHASEARDFVTLIDTFQKPSEVPPAAVERVLRSEPESGPALLASGAILEVKGDKAGAAKAYERLLVRYPDLAAAKLRLAVIGAESPTFDQKAMDYGQQARNTFPNDPELVRALGILTFRKGDDFPRAVSLLRQSLATREADAEGWMYLALSQIQIKDSAAAKKSAEKALSLGLKPSLAESLRKKVAELKS